MYCSTTGKKVKVRSVLVTFHISVPSVTVMGSSSPGTYCSALKMDQLFPKVPCAMASSGSSPLPLGLVVEIGGLVIPAFCICIFPSFH